MDRARRQVPEWEDYDQQVDKLRKRVSSSTTEEETGTAANEREKESILVKGKEHIKDEL